MGSERRPCSFAPHQPSVVEYALAACVPPGVAYRLAQPRSFGLIAERLSANDTTILWRVSAGCCATGTGGGSAVDATERGRRLHDGDRTRFCCDAPDGNAAGARRFCHGRHRHQERIATILAASFLASPVVCNLEPFATVWTAKLNHGLSLQDRLQGDSHAYDHPCQEPG